MRARGIEPPRAEAHRDLNPARLPVPPRPRTKVTVPRLPAAFACAALAAKGEETRRSDEEAGAGCDRRSSDRLRGQAVEEMAARRFRHMERPGRLGSRSRCRVHPAAATPVERVQPVPPVPTESADVDPDE